MTTLRLILVTVLFSMGIAVTAQKVTIKGNVADSADGQPVPFATVSVFNEDFDKLIRGTLSDGNGEFAIHGTGYGEFNVVISFIGYETDTIERVLISDETVPADLGEIRLSPAVVQLEEVDVRAAADVSSRGIDRQRYDASYFETAQDGTAIDVLNRIPAISAGAGGAIWLRGTTEFMVYLNGKPARADPSVLLGQIPARSVDHVEVITVPTARYVAQGKGGIINISTKTTGEEGFSFSASAMTGGAPWGNATDESGGYKLNDNRYSAGVNAVFRKEKLTVYAGLNHNKRNVNGSRTEDLRLLQSNGSYYHMVSSGKRPEWYETYSANAGLAYRFSEMNSVSASWYYGNRNKGHSAFYIYDNFFADRDKEPVNGIPALNEQIYNRITHDRYGIFQSGNVDYMHRFINNSQLQVSFLFEHSELNRELLYQNYHFDPDAGEAGQLQRSFRQTEDTPLNGYRLSVEYDIKLDNGGELGVGLQPQFLEQSGPFSYDTLNVAAGNWGNSAEQGNSIDMMRNIYAGYVDYAGGWGDFDFIAGMRVEYTDRLLELSNPDYPDIFERTGQSRYEMTRLNWFPTLHAEYGIDDRNTFILAASRRINRPSARKMAPFPYRRNFGMYETGNPALEPEYVSHAELSLNHRMGEQSITLTGFMRGTNDAILQIYAIDSEENVLVRSYSNTGSVLATGGELNAGFVAGERAHFFLGASLYSFNVEGEVFGVSENNESTNWSLTGNMNLLLTDELKLTLDLDYRSPTATIQGEKEELFLSNAALNYSPGENGRWEFGLKVLDIFSSNAEKETLRAFDSSGMEVFYRETEYERYGPIVEINVAYLLNRGSTKFKKAGSIFGEEQFSDDR